MLLKLVIGSVVGGAIGVGIGYAGKCAGGGCPLTCNPIGGMAVGVLMGALIVSTVGNATEKTDVPPSSNATTTNVTQIASAEEFDRIIGAGGPVLVDFYADWCGPCRALKPTIHALADEYAGKVTVLAVNVDKVGELAEKYGVSGIPDVQLFKGGKPVERLVGVRAQSEYKEALDKILR